MMFGNRPRATNPLDKFTAQMPGIISGYGGGTFDTGGRQVTPVQRGYDPDDDSGTVIDAPSASPSTLPTLPSSQRPRGIFGQGRWRVEEDGVPNQNPAANLPATTGAPADPRLAALIGQAPKRNKGSFGDILQAILAVGADALDPQGDGQASARVGQQWKQRGVNYDQALAAFQNRQRMATMPGMTEREMEAYLADPKAWGSNMSNAFSSRYSAATLNPGDTRVYGDPSIGGNTYQAPTRGEQYAESLGITPGTEAWNNAVRDQELGANGSTAFGNSQSLQDDRQTQAAEMERLRQRGRLTLNGAQQAGRERVRGQPTYRDTHPQPPRRRGAAGGAAAGEATARDARGNVIYYRGGRWVDASGKPVG